MLTYLLTYLLYPAETQIIAYAEQACEMNRPIGTQDGETQH